MKLFPPHLNKNYKKPLFQTRQQAAEDHDTWEKGADEVSPTAADFLPRGRPRQNVTVSLSQGDRFGAQAGQVDGACGQSPGWEAATH